MFGTAPVQTGTRPSFVLGTPARAVRKMFKCFVFVGLSCPIQKSKHMTSCFQGMLSMRPLHMSPLEPPLP